MSFMLTADYTGARPVRDLKMNCDVPGCEAVRDVTEFVNKAEVQRCLPDWKWSFWGHMCPSCSSDFA